MSDERTHFALFFDVDGRYGYGRREAKHARRKTGRTSIAVSKETAQQLRLLVNRLRFQGGYSVGFLSLDELLAVFAKGNLVVLTAQGRVAAQNVLAGEPIEQPAGRDRRQVRKRKDMQNGPARLRYCADEGCELHAKDRKTSDEKCPRCGSWLRDRRQIRKRKDMQNGEDGA